MQHFFVPPSQVGEGEILVTGPDVNHMRNVLRMRPGEELVVSDGNNRQYRCAVDHYEGENAFLSILEEKETDTELPSRIYLFQGLPKQEKMEWIVQKSVELGVCQVIPVATRRSVVRLDEKKAAKKVARWQQIAESAAKQAGRGYIPQVGDVQSYARALEQAAELDVVLIPYELERDVRRSREILEGIRPGQSVGIFIGPEGGFEKEEVEAALAAGAHPISLGRRILRTETAGLTVLSLLMFHLEA